MYISQETPWPYIWRILGNDDSLINGSRKNKVDGSAAKTMLNIQSM